MRDDNEMKELEILLSIFTEEEKEEREIVREIGSESVLIRKQKKIAELKVRYFKE